MNQHSCNFENPSWEEFLSIASAPQNPQTSEPLCTAVMPNQDSWGRSPFSQNNSSNSLGQSQLPGQAFNPSSPFPSSGLFPSSPFQSQQSSLTSLPMPSLSMSNEGSDSMRLLGLLDPLSILQPDVGGVLMETQPQKDQMDMEQIRRFQSMSVNDTHAPPQATDPDDKGRSKRKRQATVKVENNTKVNFPMSPTASPMLLITPNRNFFCASGETEDPSKIELIFDYRTDTVTFHLSFMPSGWGEIQLSKQSPPSLSFDPKKGDLKLNYELKKKVKDEPAVLAKETKKEDKRKKKNEKDTNLDQKDIMIQIFQGKEDKTQVCNICVRFLRKDGMKRDSQSLAVHLHKSIPDGEQIWLVGRNLNSIHKGDRFGRLEGKPYFHPDADRKTSEGLLLDRRPFTFLVRPCYSDEHQDKVAVVISRPVQCPPALRHHLVRYVESQQKWYYDRGEEMKSLEEFVFLWRQHWNQNHPEYPCNELFYVDRISQESVRFDMELEVEPYEQNWTSYLYVSGADQTH